MIPIVLRIPVIVLEVSHLTNGTPIILTIKQFFKEIFMRKLLLGTTALAAAASLSANTAVADISISGYYEWAYSSTSSTITSSDGTSFSTDSEIKFSFSNKTDSGLDISMVVEMPSDGTDTAVQESSLTIAGGFGKLKLGQDDGASDNYGIDAEDVVGEEIQAYAASDGLTLNDTDVHSADGDTTKITYHIPAVGGLTAGVSMTDAGTNGATGTQDITAFGAQYAMEAGGASITLGAATMTQDTVTAQDNDSTNYGIKIVSGDLTFIAATAEYEAVGADEESSGAGAKMKISDDLSAAVFSYKVEDDSTSEEYTNSGVEVAYTIASGLTAYINVEDYEYKAGTSGGTADSGTASKLTIKASF